jgi:hypothetical protein
MGDVMADKKEGWGKITTADEAKMRAEWPSNFQAEEKRYVLGVQPQLASDNQDGLVKIQLQNPKREWVAIHVPLADAMYLLGLLQTLQEATGAEIPIEPPSKQS